MRTCIVAIGIGLVVRCALVLAHPDAWRDSISVYVLTPCRLDGLVVGSLLGIGIRDPDGYNGIARRVRLPAIACAAFLGAVCVWQISKGVAPLSRTPIVETIGYTALAIAFGGLLVAALGPLRQPFSAWPLRWLGIYSYGIYVIHPFVIRALRQRTTLTFGSWQFAAAATICSLAAAWLSYQLYERHWLALKRRFA